MVPPSGQGCFSGEQFYNEAVSDDAQDPSPGVSMLPK